MSEIPITDDEVLYRRIPSGKKLYAFRLDGKIEIEPEAFEDRDCRISVDRAEICVHNPWNTLGKDDGGGVVSLVTRDVRAIKNIARMGTKERVLQPFTIDVEHMPLSENDAHAEIYGIPEFMDIDKKRAFRRLRHRIAELVEARPWEIEPRRL